MKYILLILILFSCNNDKYLTKKFSIKFEKDCHVLIGKLNDTLKFNRNLEILENTINDTIIIGDQILLPNQLGKIKYTKNKNSSLNLDYKNPSANELCIFPYKNKTVGGTLTIKFELEELDN